jgi:hypothetical protein
MSHLSPFPINPSLGLHYEFYFLSHFISQEEELQWSVGDWVDVRGIWTVEMFFKFLCLNVWQKIILLIQIQSGSLTFGEINVFLCNNLAEILTALWTNGQYVETVIQGLGFHVGITCTEGWLETCMLEEEWSTQERTTWEKNQLGNQVSHIWTVMCTKEHIITRTLQFTEIPCA